MSAIWKLLECIFREVETIKDHQSDINNHQQPSNRHGSDMLSSTLEMLRMVSRLFLSKRPSLTWATRLCPQKSNCSDGFSTGEDGGFSARKMGVPDGTRVSLDGFSTWKILRWDDCRWSWTGSWFHRWSIFDVSSMIYVTLLEINLCTHVTLKPYVQVARLIPNGASEKFLSLLQSIAIYSNPGNGRSTPYSSLPGQATIFFAIFPMYLI